MSGDSHTGRIVISPPHFPASTVADYRARRLAPAQILALHDHAAVCPACRALLTTEAQGHLSEQEAVDFVAGTFGGAATEAHLGACPECARAVGDLRAFRAELDALPVRRIQPWVWQLAAAAVVVLVAGATLWPTRPASTQATLVASLNDGPATAETRQLIADVMASGRLPEGPGGALTAARGTLRSPTTAAPAFSVLSPAGIREESDRPVFRWQALAGAEFYEVMVFDADFNEVVRSGTIRETEWQPPQALPRAKSLTWQVVAQRHGEKINAPQPPEPSAVFEIIPADAARQIDALKAAAQPSHLALAALYSREGMPDRATSELDALAAANPGSKLVESLRKVTPARSKP